MARRFLGVAPTQNLMFSRIDNLNKGRLRGAPATGPGQPVDGAERIARHYKFALSAAFRMRPTAPAIIVAEDDFLFSPDFLAYFAAMAPLLERDPTAFVVSAWNDNGLLGKTKDTGRLQRTGFFPGLGWMLSRRLFVNELEANWPKQHWDHWLRDPKQHKGRESVFPEVNRDYHAGRKCTFMDDYHHNRYFKFIDYNRTLALGPRVSALSRPSDRQRRLDDGDSAASGRWATCTRRRWRRRRSDARAGGGERRLREQRAKAGHDNGGRVRRSRRRGGGSEKGGTTTTTMAATARKRRRRQRRREVAGAVRPPRPGRGTAGRGALRRRQARQRLRGRRAEAAFMPIADFFNIWHEWYPTAHAGCLPVSLAGYGHPCSSVNVRDDKGCPSKYHSLRPSRTAVFTPLVGKTPPAAPVEALVSPPLRARANRAEVCASAPPRPPPASPPPRRRRWRRRWAWPREAGLPADQHMRGDGEGLSLQEARAPRLFEPAFVETVWPTRSLPRHNQAPRVELRGPPRRHASPLPLHYGEVQLEAADLSGKGIKIYLPPTWPVALALRALRREGKVKQKQPVAGYPRHRNNKPRTAQQQSPSCAKPHFLYTSQSTPVTDLLVISPPSRGKHQKTPHLVIRSRTKESQTPPVVQIKLNFN